MKIPVLDKVLTAERQRRRMGAHGLFVPPVARTYPAVEEEGPWITSLSTGRFTMTGPNKDGEIGQALHERLPEEEGAWLGELFRSLWAISTRLNWTNRCTSLEEAVKRMVSLGFEPKSLVVPFSTISSVVGSDLTEDEADRVTMGKGCVAEVDEVRVFSARDSIPAGSGILLAASPLVGFYTRVHDHVGATVIRADRAVVLVQADAVA